MKDNKFARMLRERFVDAAIVLENYCQFTFALSNGFNNTFWVKLQ